MNYYCSYISLYSNLFLVMRKLDNTIVYVIIIYLLSCFSKNPWNGKGSCIHRIIGSLRLENISKLIKSTLSPSTAVFTTKPFVQVLHLNVFEHFWGWCNPEQPLPVPKHPFSEAIFLIYNLPWWNLRQFLAPPLLTWEKRPIPHLTTIPFQALVEISKIPLVPPFLHEKNPEYYWHTKLTSWWCKKLIYT